MKALIENAHRPLYLTKGHTDELASALAAASRVVDEDMFILPNIRSTDSRLSHCFKDIFDILSEEFPPSSTVNGIYTGKAISGDFSKIMTVAGYPQRPMGAPVKDAGSTSWSTMAAWNELHPTEERKRWLASGFTNRNFDVLDWIMDRYCVRNGATRIHINSKSSIGLPNMIRETGDGIGLRVRAGIIEMWIEHWEKIIKLLSTGRLRDLYLVYNLIFAYIAKNRLQNDGWKEAPKNWKGLYLEMSTPSGIKRMIPKSRSVYSAFRDEVVEAAKMMELPGLHFPMSRKRTRPVAAVSWAAAAPLVGLAHIVALGMNNDSIFKVRGMGDLHLRLEENAPRAPDGTIFRQRGDVVKSDGNQPVAGLKRVTKKLEEHYGALGSLANVFFKCPCLCPPDEMGAEPVWTGSPFDFSSFTNDYVIPSGHPLTTVVTTILNLWHLLCGLEHEYGYTYADFDALLTGRHPDFVIFVGGDNIAVSGRKKLPPFEQLITPVPCEATDRIMGAIPIEDGLGKSRFSPDIRGFFDKMPPERKWDSRVKRYPAFGYFAQKEIYSAHPSAEEIYGVVNWSFKNRFGATLDSIWESVYEAPTADHSTLTPDEVFLILKPEAIHYMDFDPRAFAVLEQEMPFPFDQDRFMKMVWRVGDMDPFSLESWL